MYYRTEPNNRSDTVTYTNGGYYEKIENGQPVAIHGPSGYIGFKTSDTPAIAASHSPEASLFASAHNNTAGDFHIYTIDMEPDIDLSDELYDFGIIEEVRYHNPSDNPVTATHNTRITVPERAIEDIELAYLPPGPGIITEWAQAIKTTLQETILNGEPYPDTAAEHPGVTIEKPDKNAFENPPRAW